MLARALWTWTLVRGSPQPGDTRRQFRQCCLQWVARPAYEVLDDTVSVFVGEVLLLVLHGQRVLRVIVLALHVHHPVILLRGNELGLDVEVFARKLPVIWQEACRLRHRTRSVCRGNVHELLGARGLIVDGAACIVTSIHQRGVCDGGPSKGNDDVAADPQSSRQRGVEEGHPHCVDCVGSPGTHGKSVGVGSSAGQSIGLDSVATTHDIT